MSVGSDGKVGMVGMVGKGGTFPWGSVGFEGKGGSAVGLGRVVGVPGKLGTVVVCKRWRDARLRLMLEKLTITRKKGVMKDLAEAMVDELRRVGSVFWEGICFEIVWVLRVVLGLI